MGLRILEEPPGMNFGELQALLCDEASRGASGVRHVDGLGSSLLRVEIETVPGRAHGVFLAWEGDGDGEVVRLVAPAARLPKGHELAPDVARTLLRRNAGLPGGALALVAIEGAEHVALVVPLRLADVDAPGVLLAIVRAANAADAFEETLGGGDEL
jgi:hypothetical protein